MKVLPFVAALFPEMELNGKEALQLSADDKTKLDAETNQDGFAEAFLKYYNNEYVAANSEAQSAYDSFMEEMQAYGISPAANAEEEEEEETAEVAKADTASEKIVALANANKKVLAENKELKGNLAALKKEPEPDAPEIIEADATKNLVQVKHSKTHLFASGQAYDSLDRPWNRKVVESLQKGVAVKGATVWDKVNIEKLNDDLGAYSRRNSAEIMSMILDGYDVPAHWNVISNVQDQYVFSSIATGEITQAFKKAWLPKNKQRFVPVINKIFDKQIDVEWQPSELKSIEKSWLNMFFNEGSTPYKMSFAAYLISELMKKARKEDKINMFKGVYADPANLPEGTAGSFMNAMNGFLKIVADHRGVDYRAHDLAEITALNAYDVIQDWVENKLPIDVRNMPGLKLGLGNDVLRWYKEGHKAKYGTNNDYSELANHVYEFSNITFVKHAQLEGTGFVYITTDDNIGIMVDVPGEESTLTVEKLKRAIYAFTDYKHGIYIKAFGAKVDPTAPLDFEDQLFFSNNVQLLNDTYVPTAVNDATPSVAEHHALAIGANNTSATDITQLDDVEEGVYYQLMGNATTNASTVKNNANIILDGGDFVLNKGNKLVLLGVSGGKVIEYSRTVAGSVPEPTKVALAADATTADAADGTHFVTAANTAATAFTTIENAVAGEVYTLEGGSNTNSTTVAAGGNFLLTTSFTASLGAYLTVRYNGSKFIEVSRG